MVESNSGKKISPGGVLRILLLIVCGAVIGINVYSFNAGNLVGNKLPMPFGYGAAVVLSGSMEPTFSAGDMIIVQKSDDFEVDDIVVFQDKNSLIVHRIIETDEDTVTTKGDANNVSDEPVKRSDVKGRVIFCIPFVGKIVNFLKTPVGIAIVISATIALLEIPRIREKKKDAEQRRQILDEIERLKQENK